MVIFFARVTLLILLPGFISGSSISSASEFVFPTQEQIMGDLNGEQKYKLIQNQTGVLRIPAGFYLVWNNDGVLEIQAAGDIVFEMGSGLTYGGKGGGLILKAYNNEWDKKRNRQKVEAGSVLFEENSLIDFSQSQESALSIFYRPNADAGKHKYECPRDFSTYIRLPASKEDVYFRNFMLVENETDLTHICRYQGSYALGRSLKVTQNDHKKGESFEGIFSFNGYSLAQEGWVDFQKFTGSMLQLFFSEALHQKTISNQPPYNEGSQEKKLIVAATLGNNEIFDEYFGCYGIIDIRGRTPIHLAAMSGHRDFLEKLKEKSRNSIFLESFLGLINTVDFEGNTPLDLAALEGQPVTVIWLVEFLKSKSYPVDGLITKVRDRLSNKTLELSQRYLEDRESIPSFEQEIASLNIRYTQVLNYLRELNDNPYPLGRHYIGYPIAQRGLEAEYSYARYSNLRFFSYIFSQSSATLRLPGTSRTASFNNYFSQLYSTLAPSSPREVNLTGVPSRSRIILFNNIAVSKIAKYKDSSLKSKAYEEKRRASEEDENEKISFEDRFPITYKLQKQFISVLNNPTSNQSGNVYLRDVPSYDETEIPAQIQEIVEKFPYNQGNQMIAHLMRHSRLSGNPITTDLLGDYGYTEVLETEDFNFLNQLSLLLDFEVSRKLQEESSYFPIGIICARAFTLIEKGYLTWRQFLTKGNDYHIFTDKVKYSGDRINAMHKINALFHQRINKRNCISVSKEIIREWQEKRPYSLIITRAEEMHQELLEQYGGGYESEGEEYPDTLIKTS